MNSLFAQRKNYILIINKLQKCYRNEKCKDNSQYNAVLAIKVMARDVVVGDVPYVVQVFRLVEDDVPRCPLAMNIRYVVSSILLN